MADGESGAFSFAFDESAAALSAGGGELAIDVASDSDEQNGAGEIPDFSFNFDSFVPSAANDAAFSFDVADCSCFGRLTELISESACAADREAVVALFRQSDPTESPEAARRILLSDAE